MIGEFIRVMVINYYFSVYRLEIRHY